MKHHAFIFQQLNKFIIIRFICLSFLASLTGIGVNGQAEPLTSNLIQGGIVNGERIDKSYNFFSNSTTLKLEVELLASNQPNQLLIEIITVSGSRLLKWQVSSNDQIKNAKQIKTVLIASSQNLTLRIFGLKSNPEGLYKIWLNGIKGNGSTQPIVTNTLPPVTLPKETSVINNPSSMNESIYVEPKKINTPKEAKIIINDNGHQREVKLYEGSFALVIGNSEYTNGWESLRGVKEDVVAVKEILEKHGFVVETAENLPSRDFSNRIQQFIDDYGYQPNNRLLIYYAGHGHTLRSIGDGRDLGYIVPVDAPVSNKDEIGFKRKSIPMDDIQNFAKKIQAKHVLFIFDSCFSGKLVTRNQIAVPPVIEEKVTRAVRQFITAGAANQTVPDESIFRRTFVRALDREADMNKDGYITGTELAEYLKDKVTNYSNRQQTPQYGKINDIDLDQGDFVFILKPKDLK